MVYPDGFKQEARSRQSILLDIKGSGSTDLDKNTNWFERTLASIGAHGSIKKELFILAVREIEVSAILQGQERC